jgi:acid phosphatase family membrane protein YuiD
MEAIRIFAGSRIFVATAAAWLTAQTLKMLIYAIRFHKFDFRLLVGSGGMPSSHSAFVTCLAFSIGRQDGWDSPVFLLALGLAFVIMADAAGVRRAAGQQAQALNRILDDFYSSTPNQTKHLKELLGHTPVQVIVGSLLGALTALFFP